MRVPVLIHKYLIDRRCISKYVLRYEDTWLLSDVWAPALVQEYVIDLWCVSTFSDIWATDCSVIYKHLTWYISTWYMNDVRVPTGSGICVPGWWIMYDDLCWPLMSTCSNIYVPDWCIITCFDVRCISFLVDVWYLTTS